MELQDADAPDDAGAQPRPYGPKNEHGLTRLLWLPEDKAPVRLWPPESRPPPPAPTTTTTTL